MIYGQFFVRRVLGLGMLVMGLWLVMAGPADGQTKKEATQFWKEFDEATLNQKGPSIAPIYGAGEKGTAQLVKDINIAQTYGGYAAANEVLRAHKVEIPKANEKNEMAALKELKDSGAMQRLSDLQLSLIKKHFPTADGKMIDFNKFRKATELFANGEIRAGGDGGLREMNQLYQWVIWKQFALAAIDKGVNKSEWEKALKSLEEGFEVYKTVYPPEDRKDISGLLTSDSKRFDKTKQFTEDALKKLGDDISKLSTAEIKTREEGMIKPITQVGALAVPRDLEYAGLTVTPLDTGGYNVDLQLVLFDGFGTPVPGSSVSLLVSELGFATQEPDSFSLFTPTYDEGNGMYHATFFVPNIGVGLNFFAQDDPSNVVADTSFLVSSVPEPSSFLLCASALVILAMYRRRSVRSRNREKTRDRHVDD